MFIISKTDHDDNPEIQPVQYEGRKKHTN